MHFFLIKSVTHFGNGDFMSHLYSDAEIKKIKEQAVAEYLLEHSEILKNRWVPCSERLPNKDEYTKNDGRFIVTDGNRVYQGLFDIYRGIFVKDYFGNVPVEDECVIAWQSLPEPYNELRGKQP